ncbi:hypothetical protein IFM89_020262 [Coptis chinensis]|uniref:Uncharacterized protein n=1 Tax=Coptis chinensis TaxID=261450 RepID=A0A835LNG3_9MAGN|nr:hypothetical protein IFM89_020262 [Coptis chinensis]
MDLETENRIAKILMKEAAELRRQADKEGAHAYLRERNERFRPNARFLTATVLGVQQANRVAEVNELWRVRKKERELDHKLRGTSKEKMSHRNLSDSSRSTSSGHREHNVLQTCTSSGQKEHTSHNAAPSKIEVVNSYSSDDGGLQDNEVEQFLHKRVKRGRGGVGPRMDEPGPYLPCPSLDSRTRLSVSPDVGDGEYRRGRVLGPEKPPSLKSNRSFDGGADEDDWKEMKKVKVERWRKHSKKQARKEEKDANKKKKERKSKHKHTSRHC